MLSPPFTLPPPPLDRLEAACAFATECGGALLPLLRLLTLRRSRRASIESKRQAVRKVFSKLPSCAPPSPLIEAACGLGRRSGLAPLQTSPLCRYRFLGTTQRVA